MFLETGLQESFMKNRIYILSIFLFCGNLYAQDTKPKRADTLNILPSTIIDGETVPQFTLDEVEVLGHPTFTKKRYARRYSRLVKNVKKVYPYAKFIKIKLDDINDHLIYIEDEKEQKKFIKQVQKDIVGEFESDVRKMTFTQGKILIKLIDRETGETSYEWLKEMRGDLFAGFWQTVARIFGNDLKAEFDAKGEDRRIDQIVRMIDAGLI